jgi:FkbM family methyltransferase
VKIVADVKRLIFHAGSSLAGLFGYDLAKRGLWSLGNADSVSALAVHLQKLFPVIGIDTVIDVGANQGQYYQFLRERVGFRGRVVSFEPIPELAAQLQDRARSERDWTVHNVALGRSPGKLPFHISNKTGWSSLLKKSETDVNEFAAGVAIERVVEVQVDTLERMFADRSAGLDPGRCYLKLDSQGFDFEIMLGAGAALAKVPALQSELEFIKVYDGAPDYLKVLEFLRTSGFAISGLFPVWTDKDLRIGELDAVFRNESRIKI